MMDWIYWMVDEFRVELHETYLPYTTRLNKPVLMKMVILVTKRTSAFMSMNVTAEFLNVKYFAQADLSCKNCVQNFDRPRLQ